MQLPDLPSTPHVHSPGGPQTIGAPGAASAASTQSVSVLQGLGGISQTPQPDGTPPGAHCMPEVQSWSELHVADPSEEVPESSAQAMFEVATCQLPPLHVASTLHP